jgi:carbonic anhydrase
MLHQQIDFELAEREAWALRRQQGIPNNRRLMVLSCMDERVPVEQALGIRVGDAHVFRNAGAVVTDDVIRSAMITTNFLGTKEIVVLGHTECGSMKATGEYLANALKERGINIDSVTIDPALPELRLDLGAFPKWLKAFQRVDDATVQQVELLRGSPLIPDDVVIHGYVWEVENMRLRRPHAALSERVNSREAMGGKR